MSELRGFVYGENVEGMPPRGLGFRLLIPVEPASWSSEVETLARRLQATPYPEHWPPSELFCSVVLATGERLVALARYGLVDRTPSRRRGGIELRGVVGPTTLTIDQALAISRWLRQQGESFRQHAGPHDLAAILAACPVAPIPPDELTPVLPVRLWQDGTLLFAATSPTDPDHHLHLLSQHAERPWQWLPLVPPDFPFAPLAQRGPVLAWTPHLSSVAVKLEDHDDRVSAAPASPLRDAISWSVLALVVLLGIVQAWLIVRLQAEVGQLASKVDQLRPPPDDSPSRREGVERWANALVRLARRSDVPREADPAQARRAYERLVAGDRDLGLGGEEGKVAVLAVAAAAGTAGKREPRQVESAIRRAMKELGQDSRLVDVLCEKVRDELEKP